MSDFWGSMIGSAMDTTATTITNYLWRKHDEARQDSAIQRRVRDLKAAGINPILAAGNPAESGRAQPPTIDSEIGENLLNSITISNMKKDGKLKDLESEQLGQAIEQLKQEIAERKRNIDFYKKHDMPSDRQPSWAMDLAQAIEMLKGNTGDTIKNAIVGALDSPTDRRLSEKTQESKESPTNPFFRAKTVPSYQDARKKQPIY